VSFTLTSVLVDTAGNPIANQTVIARAASTPYFEQESYNRVRDIELCGPAIGGLPTYAGGTSDGLVLMGGDSLIDNVTCSYFSRDGFHCENNLPSSTSDNSMFLRCIAVGNKRHGFFNQGGDSQNMAFQLCNASANGIYGFYNGSATSLVVSATMTTVTVTAGDGKLFQVKTLLNVDPNVTANKRVISSISSSGLGDVLTVTPNFSTIPTANQLLRGGVKASTLASVNALVSCTVAAGDGVLFSNQRPTQPMTFMLITAASVTQNGTGTISGDTITWTTAPGTTPNVGDMIYINGAPAGSNHNSFYSCHHNSNGIGAVYENGVGNTYIHFYAEGGTGSQATIGKESSTGTWLHNSSYADVGTFTIDALAKPNWWVQRSGHASLPGAVSAASVTTVNSVIPYYDASGTLLGYVPIYTTHT